MTLFSEAAERISGAWQARHARERRMLVVMAAAMAAFLYWYGGVMPLRKLAAGAESRSERAAARLAAVRGDLSALAAARESLPAAPDGAAYAATILETAGAAGVSVSRQRARGAGGLATGIDGVEASALFSWLDTLRTAHGIVPDTLDIGRRGGRLQAEVAFPGPPDEPQHN